MRSFRKDLQKTKNRLLFIQSQVSFTVAGGSGFLNLPDWIKIFVISCTGGNTIFYFPDEVDGGQSIITSFSGTGSTVVNNIVGGVANQGLFLAQATITFPIPIITRLIRISLPTGTGARNVFIGYSY